MVKTNAIGEILFAVYGPINLLVPSAFKAELYGLVIAAENAFPPLTLWIDCLSVICAFEKGRAWCCNSARVGADLWRRVFDAFDAWQNQRETEPWLKLRWTKGHATDKHIQEGKVSHRAKASNDHADELAKRGAEVAETFKPNSELVQAYKCSRAWLSYLEVFADNWPAAKVLELPPPKPCGAIKPIRRQIPLHPRFPHQLWRTPSGVTCTRCRKTAASPQTIAKLRPSPCSGAGVSSANAVRAHEEILVQRGGARTDAPEPPAPLAKRRRLRVKTRQQQHLEAEAVARADFLFGTAWRRTVHFTHKVALADKVVFCLNCAHFASTVSRIGCLREPCKHAAADKASWQHRQLQALKTSKPRKIKKRQAVMRAPSL